MKRRAFMAAPVGYGVAEDEEIALGGVTASGEPGTGVMNIGDGYGAASAAARILTLTSSLKSHSVLAKKHGVSKEKMVENITQLGFYADWPKAWAVFGMAKKAYGDDK